MRIQILDKTSRCIIGKVSLWEYLDSVNSDAFEFELQRGVVSNPYLDTILTSINNNEALPPFTLVVDGNYNINDSSIDIESFDILDGLQRTYRLYLYKLLARIVEEKNEDRYKEACYYLVEMYPTYSYVLSPRIIRHLFKKEQEHNIWNIKDDFKKFYIYVYIWLNLDEEEQIRKMLILNAGHKSMSLSHQYELNYIRIFNNIQLDDVKLVRAKDFEYNEIKHGSRTVGHYLLPSVIIAIRSLIKGKPVRLSSDLLLSDLRNNAVISDEDNLDETNYFLNKSFAQDFLYCLLDLDKKISITPKATEWFAKDTTLSGIMAGLGKTIKEDIKSTPSKLIYEVKLKIEMLVNDDPFQLHDFNEEYPKLPSNSINIGTVLRRAISYYSEDIFNGLSPKWDNIFKQALTNTRNDKKRSV